MVRRLGALVLAVALVVGAVALRRSLDGGSLLADPSVVVCDPIVVEACRAAFDGHEIRSEEPGITLRRLADEAAPDPFIWVTSEQWVAMTTSELTRLARSTDRLGTPAPARASTRVAVIFALGSGERCAELTWACVAALEDLDVAAPPTDSTIGLLARVEAAAAVNGSGQFSRADLARLYPDWISMADAARVLATRPGELDVAFDDAAGADTIVRAVEVGVPSDSRTEVTIVAVGVGGARNDIDPTDLGRALRSAGWSETPGPATADPVSVNGLLAVWSR